MTGMNFRPTRRVKAARAVAKFPEEDSITVVSSQISPRWAARLRIQKAGRSLMLPTGLTYSSLAKRRMPFMSKGTCGWVETHFLAVPSARQDLMAGRRAGGRPGPFRFHIDIGSRGLFREIPGPSGEWASVTAGARAQA